MHERHPSAADLRAEIARRRLHLYHVAAEAGVNPSRLGAMLNERIALPVATATAISGALERLAARAPDAERRSRRRDDHGH